MTSCTTNNIQSIPEQGYARAGWQWVKDKKTHLDDVVSQYTPKIPYQDQTLEGAKMAAEWGMIYAPDFPVMAGWQWLKGKLQIVEGVNLPFKLLEKIGSLQKKLMETDAWLSKASLESVVKAHSVFRTAKKAAEAFDRYVLPVLTPVTSLLLTQASLVIGLVGSISALILGGWDVSEKSDIEKTGEKALFVAFLRFAASVYAVALAILLVTAALLEVVIAPVYLAAALSWIFLTNIVADFYDAIL